MTDERKALEEAFREVFGDTVLMVCEHGARSERDTAFRFTAMLDCGAYLNAAMMLVPEGTGYLAGVREGGPDRRLLLAVCEHGEPVDVLALSSTVEDEWALLTGVCPILGWDALVRAQMGLTDRLRVWTTPMAWLRAGGVGICVLQWDDAALGLLRGLGQGVRLIVDAAAKERLRGLLAYGGLPRIEAASIQGRIAA